MAGAKDSNSDNDDRVSNQSTDSSAVDDKKRGNEDSSSSSPSSSSMVVEVSSCSICLELVADDGIRSRAKLQCGHEFHLDCIGSAFNMKGAMQCPNCRNVEKGQWLYANGSSRSSFPEFVMEDWIPEEDLYALTYPEMQYRVHWCPFGEPSQAGSFEEVENGTTTYHNDFHGHHHHPHAAAAMNHSYLAYIAPNPIPTPRTQDNNNNNNNAEDHPWNHQLAIAPQYHHHQHHSPSFPLPGAHVVDSDIDSSSVARGLSYPHHPFLFSYRSNPRTSPPMQYHQRQQHGPNLVSVTRRGLPPPPPPPMPPMPDQNGGGFFVYPQPPSSSETDQFHHTWERDWFPHFPVPVNHRSVSSVWHRHF